MVNPLFKSKASSYLPTLAEMLEGVQWIRDNPVIAAGVVVGITSYSVIKFCERYADHGAEEDDLIKKDKASRHVEVLEDFANQEEPKCHTVDSSASTESSLASLGGLRPLASFYLDKIDYEELHAEEDAVESVWSCLHEGKCPPGEHCSDLAWGWFVPDPNSTTFSNDQSSESICLGLMTYYRIGQRLTRTRAVVRAMARSSAGKWNSATLEKLVQNSKSRFGSAVTRPLGAAIATFLDSGVAFNVSSEFLYFDVSTELRVSENFPSVPNSCEKVATSFFACFYGHGKQPKGTPDADVGNVALEKCKDVLLAYNTCVDAEVAKNPKELFRVPESYRSRG
ncbi:hypothetical protein CCR75_008670 [Bremia lactucae]|uniref:Uncharacterized protein n=1 Tax=Bremia lactucae TaxID=4779 RepID=A0A976IFC9_BRELC|nr:hypothetical protein CCR75_008670 [Bremia lactucae]